MASYSENLLNAIRKIDEEFPDLHFAKTAMHHTKVLEKVYNFKDEKDPKSFKSREEYIEFAISKMFIDTIPVFESPKAASCKDTYVDTLPPLRAFHLSPEEQEMYRKNFLKTIPIGTILNLKIIEDNVDEYTLLVFNKYNDKERVIDYDVKVYLLKNEHVRQVGAIKIGDYIRAAAFGNLTIKDQSEPRFIVSLNPSRISSEYKGVKLGIISKEEIQYYPEDLSGYKRFLDYASVHMERETDKDTENRFASLGVDMRAPYSYFKKPHEKITKHVIPTLDSSVKEWPVIKATNLLKEAEICMQNNDLPKALATVNESLQIYDHDRAYALRGQIYLKMADGKPCRAVKKACFDFEKSLTLNPFNQLAKSEYSQLCISSITKHAQNKDPVSEDKAAKLLEAVKKFNILIRPGVEVAMEEDIPVSVKQEKP